MTIVVFEDEHVPRLYPVTLARPAYAITCGAFRLLDWLTQLDRPIHAIVRSHLADIQKNDYPDLGDWRPGESQSTLLVNARMVPSRAVFQALKQILKSDQAGVVKHNGEVAALLLARNAGLVAEAPTVAQLPQYLAKLGVEQLDPLDHELPLLEYPHDVVRYNMQILSENLEHRLSNGAYQEVADGVFVGDNARLGNYLVTDTSSGPVIVEHNAVIGPFCYLNGPAFIGHSAKLIEHAAVKDAVSIGHTTKIGGEVEASVIEPYTNKQHHGFLGHGYLGSWINLVAGTCNSDLKNTYGTVNVDDQSEKIATQQRMFRRRKVEQRPCDLQLLHDMYELSRDERQLAGDPLSL